MKIYDKLKVGLDVTDIRSKVIANNIANVNTKGYKGKYVSFDGVYDAKSVRDAKSKIIIKENDNSQYCTV